MKEKKGFTMVELLAVVVILGIIGTIGVAGVTRIIKSSHERHNLAQAKLFVSGAQIYFTDNKSKLPTKTFTSKEVSLSTLQELNYVEKIVDYKKEAYDSEKSYAYVTKMGTGKYAYDGELITKDGQRTKYKPEKNDNGSVVFSIEGKDFTNKTAYTNARNKKDVKVKIKDPDTIAGYIITLYKGGKELRQLEYREIGNQKEVETTIKISPEEYPDGQYQIQVKVIDIYNNQLIRKSGTLVVDTIAPQCSTQLKGKIGENDWYVSDVKTKAICQDLDEKGNSKKGSGCLSTTWLTTSGATDNVTNQEVKTSWTIKKDGISNLNYRVSDKAGNETECKTIQVKVDQNPPNITRLQVDTKGDHYSTNIVGIGVEINDTNNLNNVKYDMSLEQTNNNYNNMKYGPDKAISQYHDSFKISDTYDGTKRTIYITAKDEAGNKTIKSQNYTVYKQCSKTTTTSLTPIQKCPICGSGKSISLEKRKDRYLNVDCDRQVTQKCNGLPDCCSNVEYDDGNECYSKANCGKGTKNRLAYSRYNNKRCKSKDKKSGGASCVKTKCAKKKNTCYVGNTRYCFDYSIGNGDCPTAIKGYWFYCTINKKGTLRTALGRSLPGYKEADHVQWACPINEEKIKNAGVGGKVEISGDSYTVIDDSDDFWELVSPDPSLYPNPNQYKILNHRIC